MRRGLSNLMVAAATVAYLVLGVFPYAVSALVVPGAAAWLLWAAWALGLAGLVFTARRRPELTPAFPIVALVLWVAFVSLGGWIFGWTA